jgi:hypothetical protein
MTKMRVEIDDELLLQVRNLMREVRHSPSG